MAISILSEAVNQIHLTSSPCANMRPTSYIMRLWAPWHTHFPLSKDISYLETGPRCTKLWKFCGNSHSETTPNPVFSSSRDSVVKTSSCSVTQSYVSSESSYLLLLSWYDGVKCELSLAAATAHSTPCYLKELSRTPPLLHSFPHYSHSGQRQLANASSLSPAIILASSPKI